MKTRDGDGRGRVQSPAREIIREPAREVRKGLSLFAEVRRGGYSSGHRGK
ncbi:MAG TPA: hypothetical protein VIQ24_02595 [Pyrinomonadaceae bacterium]